MYLTHHACCVNTVEHECKDSPKRLNNPTAIYNNPKRLMHIVYAVVCLTLTCRRKEHEWQRTTTQTKRNVSTNPILTSNEQQHGAGKLTVTCEERKGDESRRRNKHNNERPSGLGTCIASTAPL